MRDQTYILHYWYAAHAFAKYEKLEINDCDGKIYLSYI